MASPCSRSRTSATCAPASTTTCCAAGCCTPATTSRFIRNITDVDDKVLEKSVRAGPAVLGHRVRERAGARRRTTGRSTCCSRPTSRWRPAHIPEMHELIEMLIAERPRVRGGRRQRRRLLRRASYPGVRRAVRPAARTTCAGRTTAASADKRDSARLRAVEGRQGRASRPTRPGRRRGAAAGPAGTSSARRWPGATSARVRHPRRRPRPDVPAPRERDRPVPVGRARRSPATGCTTRCSTSARPR